MRKSSPTIYRKDEDKIWWYLSQKCKMGEGPSEMPRCLPPSLMKWGIARPPHTRCGMWMPVYSLCLCLYIFSLCLSISPPHTHTQGLHTHALTINTDINIQCTKPPWSWSEDTLMLMQAALRALTRLGVSWRLWGTVCKFIVLLAQPGSWQSQNPGELFLLALGSQLHGFSSKTSSS